MKRYIIGGIIFLCLFSCKKNEDKVTIQFSFTNNVGTTNANRAYNLDLTNTLILFSNFEYIDSLGNATKVKDVFLVKNNNTSFKFEVPNGNFTTFRFSFGIDTTLNNSLPSSYPASSPLSVETGLYWDMLKYRFLITEGNIDSSLAKNKIPNMPFSMHLGNDTLYSVINTHEVPMKGAIVNINLDMKSLMILDSDPFKITNFSNHSEASDIPNAVAIKNSFVNNINITTTYP